jgi:hypothetical protein
MERYVLAVLAALLVLPGGGSAQDTPTLMSRVPYLAERLHSSRWQVRYCLLGELMDRDPETKHAIEELCQDENARVAQQALVRYEHQFVNVNETLFEPKRYLPPSEIVANLPADAPRRALVDYCLGRRKIHLDCGMGTPPVLDTARLDDPEMHRPITIVGLLGDGDDAASLRAFLRSTNPFILLAAAKAMIRLGHRDDGLNALRELTTWDPKEHLHYITEALHALRELECSGLKAIVERVVAAVDGVEDIQPNWMSGFLLLAADVTKPEVLAKAGAVR